MQSTAEVVVPNKRDLEDAVEMEICDAEDLFECDCTVEWLVPGEDCVITNPLTGEYEEIHIAVED